MKMYKGKQRIAIFIGFLILITILLFWGLSVWFHPPPELERNRIHGEVHGTPDPSLLTGVPTVAHIEATIKPNPFHIFEK